jgi:hypothetical protein
MNETTSLLNGESYALNQLVFQLFFIYSLLYLATFS